jgi:signal transduction histidine kinase
VLDARRSDGRLVLDLDDPGEPSPQQARAGLLDVADRVGALDGELDVAGAPGGGVRITAELPCE